MFGKEVVEFCTLAVYWVLVMPTVLVFIDSKYNGNPLDYFTNNSEVFLYLIGGYLVTFRIVMMIFMQLKYLDLRIWNRLPTEKAILRLELEEKKQQYKRNDLDAVDGSPPTTRIPKKVAPLPPSTLIKDNQFSVVEVHETPKKKKSIV